MLGSWLCRCRPAKFATGKSTMEEDAVMDMAPPSDIASYFFQCIGRSFAVPARGHCARGLRVNPFIVNAKPGGLLQVLRSALVIVPIIGRMYVARSLGDKILVQNEQTSAVVPVTALGAWIPKVENVSSCSFGLFQCSSFYCRVRQI